MVAAQLFLDRKRATDERLAQFQQKFRERLAQGPDRFQNDTCLYVTGSGGRGELSRHSDLDLFLVRDGDRPSRLDEMVLGAAVEGALRDCSFPPPSNDGEFLTLHRVTEMLIHMGTPADDARNLFTARMLLLLESRCIDGAHVYERVIDKVLDEYWRNLDKHPDDYLPIILLNDVCRYWRVVLLNYEAKQNPQGDRVPNPTEEERAARRLRSHKLRYSRCLLCYSAIAFLLAEARSKNVTRAAVRHMVRKTPLERFAYVSEKESGVPRATIDELFNQYAEFLERMDAPKSELVLKFQDPTLRRECSQKGEIFGATIATLMAQLGEDNPLYRYLIV